MNAGIPEAVCRSCSAPIIWAVTDTGKRTPVDADPAPGGTIQLAAGRPPLAIIHSRQDAADRVAETGVQLRASHFQTCPNADRHRRRTQQQQHHAETPALPDATGDE